MPSISVIDGLGAQQLVQTLPSVGQSNKAGSLPIVMASDSDPVATVSVGFAKVVASNNITRLANTTAYTAGQIIGGSATVGFANNGFTFPSAARTAGGVFQINRARLYKSQANALGTFELVLFRAQPTITVGDAGAFSSGVPLGNSVAASRVVGRFAFDMTTALVGSDGAELAALPMSNSPILVSLPGAAVDLFGIIRSTGAYTPASAETFSVVLEGYAF